MAAQVDSSSDTDMPPGSAWKFEIETANTAAQMAEDAAFLVRSQGKRFVFLEDSFVTVDMNVQPAQADIDAMTHILTRNPSEDDKDKRIMLVIINMHGAILVNDITPIEHIILPTIPGTVAPRIITENEIRGHPAAAEISTLKDLERYAFKVQDIPEGMSVFQYKATNKCATLHKNFRLDTTAKVLYDVFTLSEKPITSAGVNAYTKKIIDSVRKEHDAHVQSYGIKVPALDVLWNLHSNNVMGAPPLYDSFYYSDATPGDIGKSIGFFPFFGEGVPAIECSTESLLPGEAYYTCLNDILEMAAKKGANEVYIMDGACAVKRTSSQMKPIFKVAHENREHKENGEPLTSINGGLPIYVMVDDVSMETTPDQDLGGKRTKRTKRKRTKRRTKRKRTQR